MNAPPSAPTPRQAGAQSLHNTWLSLWGQRSAREQHLLGWASLVLVLATVWSLALAPALRTWQQAPGKQAQLDAQSQRMRQLQLQAKSLQKPPTLTRAEAAQWLENSLGSLGPNAQISLQDERATLRVQAAPADALARWMSQARDNAQALPLQAELQQTEAATSLTGSQPSGASRADQAAGASPSPTPSQTTRQTSLQTSPQTDATAGSANKSDPVWRGSMVLRLP